MGGGGGVAEASESDAGVTIHIRCSNGSKFSIQITLVSTVGSFKSVLAHNCDIPAEHQHLIYKGRILKDDQTLQSYDHATGVIRHAHRTMIEVLPNQVPLVLPDDSCASETNPHTPEMSTPIRALFDPDDLQKDASGLSSSRFHAAKRNGAHTEESDFVTIRKGFETVQ